MNEEELIRLATARVLAALRGADADPDEIPVGVSVRHAHLCREDLEILYGPGAQLTKVRDLRQPGEFASGQTVTLVGPRMRALENVRILGPLRRVSQVEISRTDAIYLGINPPVRRSGELDGTPGLTLIGPRGALNLRQGVICANRHIHMSPADAQRLGLKDNEEIEVEVGGDKALIFRHCQVRVGDFRLEMHLDTDDANAAGVTCGAKARIRR